MAMHECQDFDFVNQIISKAIYLSLVPITRLGKILFRLISEKGNSVQPLRPSSLKTSLAGVR